MGTKNVSRIVWFRDFLQRDETILCTESRFRNYIKPLSWYAKPFLNIFFWQRCISGAMFRFAELNDRTILFSGKASLTKKMLRKGFTHYDKVWYRPGNVSLKKISFRVRLVDQKIFYEKSRDQKMLGQFGSETFYNETRLYCVQRVVSETISNRCHGRNLFWIFFLTAMHFRSYVSFRWERYYSPEKHR